jgi:alpha-tubulin suppressor-like RCC1 family protein
VIGLLNVQSLAAGEDFSVAVQQDGAASGWVWAWGKNDAGQLVDGTTLSRAIPTRVPTLDGVAEVAAGRAFVVARLLDGTVRAWGANDEGQLGIGSTATMPGVHTVATMAGVRRIAAGWYHGLAVDVDGRLWGWGRNWGWQLGVPNHGSSAMPAPQLIVQVPGALSVAAGTDHTLALQADGTVWGIGSGAATSSGTSLTTGVPVAGFDAGDQTALTSDQDEDGVPTWRELARGTDPLNADTNGNGLTDLVELDVVAAGAHADEDGDGVGSPGRVSTRSHAVRTARANTR